MRDKPSNIIPVTFTPDKIPACHFTGWRKDKVRRHHGGGRYSWAVVCQFTGYPAHIALFGFN